MKVILLPDLLIATMEMLKDWYLTLEKRYANYFSAKVDYTYQIAQGNASDPTQEYFIIINLNPPMETTKKLIPLNWDQRSTLNLSLTVGESGQTGLLELFGAYGSGTPYTEDSRYTKGIRLENNGRKPSTINVDLKATKTFNVFDLDLNTYLIVYNVFDIKNELMLALPAVVQVLILQQKNTREQFMD